MTTSSCKQCTDHIGDCIYKTSSDDGSGTGKNTAAEIICSFYILFNVKICYISNTVHSVVCNFQCHYLPCNR